MAHCLDKIQDCTGRDNCECPCDDCFDELFEYDEEEEEGGVEPDDETINDYE